MNAFESSQQADFFPQLIPPQIAPTYGDVGFTTGRFSKRGYTKAQRARGGIKRASNLRDASIRLIESLLPAYALACEDSGVRFTLSGFFRSSFPDRNPEAMRRLYGSYVKGRLESIFRGACDAVNRFKSFCQAVRAASKLKSTRSIVREWCRLGVALSSNPFRKSLERVARWRDDLRIWEQLEIFPSVRAA